jgi:hypothetical protein
MGLLMNHRALEKQAASFKLITEIYIKNYVILTV